MLVLTRTKGKKIGIGPWLTVTVNDIRGEKVRLGVEETALADSKLFYIDREEVAHRRPSRYMRVLCKYDAGKSGRVVGLPFFCGGNMYAPVRWDGSDVPVLELEASLEMVREDWDERAVPK